MKLKRRIFWVCVVASFIVFSCKKKTIVDIDGGSTQQPPSIIYKPNTTVYGSNKYVKFIVGDPNSPIILASPHDGSLTPSNMAIRTHADAVTVRDIYVSDLTLEISDALYAKTGIRPHVIINDISRARMEPNRSLSETYQSDAANLLWKEYHDFLKGARDMVTNNVGKGVFFDMHGHGHTKQRIEVGYIVSKANLNNTDAVLNSVPGSSSIFHLAKNSSYTFSQLVRGDYAFGTLLENEGVPAVPSKQDPKPNSDDYFNGGYCTLTYGSKDGGVVSAIQLETHGSNLRNNATQRKASGVKIADAIIKYMKHHYNLYN